MQNRRFSSTNQYSKPLKPHKILAHRASHSLPRYDEMLKIAEARLKSQHNKTSIIKEELRITDIWEKLLKESIQGHYTILSNHEKAAILIQRILKGCVVRSKYAPMLLISKEAKLAKKILSLRGQTDKCMLTLGLNTIPSVKYIQKAFRRYLFRKKLKVLWSAYNLHLEKQREKSEKFLQVMMINFSCILKKHHLIFLKLRAMRLHIIRRNLAVLAIKIIWKKKKLSVKILKQRIARAKRIKIAKQNKEAFEKYLSTLGSSFNAAKKESQRESEKSPAEFKSQEKTEDADTKGLTEGATIEKSNDDKKEGSDNGEKHLNTEEARERAEEERLLKESERIKAMVQRRIKYLIEKGKVAHGITLKDPKAAIPVIDERALNEMDRQINEESSKGRLMESTYSTIAKNRPASREKSATTRTFYYKTPKYSEKNVSALMDDQKYRYLLTTYDPEIPPKFHSLDGDERILRGTESFHNKIFDIVSVNKKKQLAFDGEHKISMKHPRIRRKRLNQDFKERVMKDPPRRWIPIARETHTYIPGLENSAYISEKWKPISLNRSVLLTAPRSAKHRPTTALSASMTYGLESKSPMAYKPTNFTLSSVHRHSPEPSFNKLLNS